MSATTPRPAPAPSARRSAGASFPGKLLSGRADLLVDVAAIDRIAVAGKRLVPPADGVVVTSHLEEQLAVVVLHDGVRPELIGGLLQVVEREIELAVLEVGPADAVEKRPVIGIDRQRTLDEIDRLVQA